MKIFKSKLREVSAVYKTSDVVPNVKISQSKDVADYIRQVYPVEINIREAMVVLFLSNSNKSIGWSIASIGGITATIVDVRLVLRDALLTQATSIILVHNHPSGSLNPSKSDLSITHKVKKAAELMDIKLLDHLILTEDAYFSFVDEGKL
ncbi:JAB domain-containing protein [Lutimonas saemankumensis]|uniref:JAB domain-containing protein n=1 Tax=Lutimonas saemankumensis TaxID=483016 RepID=UPI001CD6F3F0|nr:JAB domain-containing protein [Lutimonas saemankumensis]MCA0933917.1 JAB domain-containing protein [Lutimonas saemankumensis]